MKSGSTATGLMSDQRAVELVHPVHQDRVLVDLLLLDLDETLADRFDVADARISSLQWPRAKPSETVVLPSFWRVAAINTRGVSVFILVRALSRSFLHVVGIEFRVGDRLHADDGGDAENVVRVGAAGDIGGGPVQAEQDLAVGVGPGDMLDQFAGDVAGVQIGEDEDVGPARPRGSPAVSGAAISRHQRGIDLEFTRRSRRPFLLPRPLFGEGGGGLHLANPKEWVRFLSWSGRAAPPGGGCRGVFWPGRQVETAMSES